MPDVVGNSEHFISVRGLLIQIRYIPDAFINSSTSLNWDNVQVPQNNSSQASISAADIL